MKISDDLIKELRAIPGGYEYDGCASLQICFPLKAGGELRFIATDDEPVWHVEYYDGALPPGITGPAKKTGL